MSFDSLQDLRDAIDGLDYPSESDAPFEPIDWPGTPPAEQQVRATCGASARLSEITEDEFFQPLAATTDAERFEHLRQVLRQLVGPVRVLRAECEDSLVRVFVVGQTPGGRSAGVQTTSVET
jgi:hypothetical protein